MLHSILDFFSNVAASDDSCAAIRHQVVDIFTKWDPVILGVELDF